MPEDTQNSIPKISLWDLQVHDNWSHDIANTVPEVSKIPEIISSPTDTSTPLQTLPSTSTLPTPTKISLSTLQIIDHPVTVEPIAPAENSSAVNSTEVIWKKVPSALPSEPQKEVAKEVIQEAEKTVEPVETKENKEPPKWSAKKEEKKVHTAPKPLRLDLSEIQSGFTILWDHVKDSSKETPSASVKSEVLQPVIVKKELPSELFKNYESSFLKRRDIIMVQLKRMRGIAKTNFKFIFWALIITSIGIYWLSYIDPKIHNYYNYKTNIIHWYHKAQDTVTWFGFWKKTDDIQSALDDWKDVLKSQQTLLWTKTWAITQTNSGTIETATWSESISETSIWTQDISETSTWSEIQIEEVIEIKLPENILIIRKEKIKDYFSK